MFITSFQLWTILKSDFGTDRFKLVNNVIHVSSEVYVQFNSPYSMLQVQWSCRLLGYSILICDFNLKLRSKNIANCEQRYCEQRYRADAKVPFDKLLSVPRSLLQSKFFANILTHQLSRKHGTNYHRFSCFIDHQQNDEL